MIEIYLKTNTNYSENGDITLTPNSCIYKESSKLITLEHSLDDLGRWKYIKEENVISIPEDGKKKYYRIYNIVKTLYSITAYARPLFYDLADTILLDVRPTSKNAEEALNIILQGTGFIGHSNISNINTAYYIRKNIVEAILGDDENSFLNRWGGELYIDNYDIYINEQIGYDNGVRVEFGYNLNAIEEEVNIGEVVTRIIPVGANEIMLEGNKPWVDSPIINKYTKVKMRVITFNDVKVKDSPIDENGFDTIEDARAELINRCNKLYEEGIDKPLVNYNIDMINLANTTAYKEYKGLLDVRIGDTVTCYVKNLDIDVKARVIDYEKDLITGEYISIELGNVVYNFFNKQVDIQGRVDNILNSNGTVKANEIQGFIDSTKAIIKAQKDVAKKLDVRAIQCEDLDPDSPNFGSWIGGTKGIQISEQRTPDNRDWEYTAALTAKGLVANMLYGKILAGEGVFFDLENGEVLFNKGMIKGSNSYFDLDKGEIACKLPDGSEVVMSAQEGFYRKVGGNKNEYHSLFKTFEYQINTSGIGNTFDFNITLPSEFKNKNFLIIPIITDAVSQENDGKTLYISGRNGVWIKNINKSAGTFNVYGQYIAFKVITTNEFGGIVDTEKAYYGCYVNDPAILPLKVNISILVIS